MSKLTILVIVASVTPAAPAVSFGRAPVNGLMHLGHPLSTLAQGRSSADVVKSQKEEASNLEEYCAGSPEVAEKDAIMANWKNYGTFYPGVVKAKNKDGSIDVLYDDGWTEAAVPKGSFKPQENKKEKNQQRDDAACELAEDVKDVKKKLKDAEKDVGLYLASQRAAATNKVPGAPSPAAAEVAPESIPAAAAPAPASMSNVDGEEANELQKLKDELDEVNAEIAGTEAKLQANGEMLKGLLGQAGNATDTQPKSVDDLIAEYKAKIGERRNVLRSLKEQLKQQEQQMAAMGAASVGLEDIQESVKDVAADMENITVKRNKLEEEDRLDPELRAAVDSMLEYGKKLQDRIQELFEAREKADAAKKAAEAARVKAEAARKAAEAQAAKEQAEAARQAAEAEAARKAAKTEAERAEAAKKAAEAEAARMKAERAREAAKAEKEATEAAEQAAVDAEKEVFQAGEEVEKEIKIVGKETEMLDSGVHPNGDKWWRYRYEHSFVEALVMIFVSVLMLIYEKLLNWLRYEVYQKSFMRATFGTMYSVWLEFASLQMLACLVVFLTIWLLGHCGAFDLLAAHFHGSEVMRLPHVGSQYRHLAFDICTCLIMALLFYFILMFSAVHSAMNAMHRWAVADVEETAIVKEETRAASESEVTMSGSLSMSLATAKMKRATTFYGTAEQFNRRKRYFLAVMADHPDVVKMLETPRDADSAVDEEAVLERFPFWKYLRANVRATMDSFLELGTPLWLGVIATFVLLLFLHHFLHMGYIRVMTFFLVVQCAALGLSMFLVSHVNSVIEDEVIEDEQEKASSRPTLERKKTFMYQKKSMFLAWLLKTSVVYMLQYTLFFLCYGVARSICQPWMWKLHFWLVLSIFVVSCVLTVIFIVSVSPFLTAFAASMAMPPYIDVHNMARLKQLIVDLQGDTMTAQEFVDLGRRSTSSLYNRSPTGLLNWGGQP